MKYSGSWYGAWYFCHCCGDTPYGRSPEWLRFFSNIADRIIAEIAPRTVLDVGCAMGLLVEALRERGVEAFGVDISEYALSQAREDIRPFIWRASVLDPLPCRYDLIVCIEVLEHLAIQDVQKAVENLCGATDDVLFSSTPSDYGEATHLNVQPIEYWAERFALEGFYHDLSFDATFIAPWAMRFRRSLDPPHRIVREYERNLYRLSRENSELRSRLITMQKYLCQLEDERAVSRDKLLQLNKGNRETRVFQWRRIVVRAVSAGKVLAGALGRHALELYHLTWSLFHDQSKGVGQK